MKRLFITILCTFSTFANSNPLFEKQWYLKNIGQFDFYRTEELVLQKQAGIPGVDINWVKKTSSTQETIVAVIDSGIDLDHPDLVGRILKGKNFLHPEDSVQDDTGHGTHVAGLIAANDNNIGIIGVSGENNKIKIMPLKVLSQSTKSFSYNKKLITEYFAEAINYAIDNKADVINMSVGFPILVLNEKFINAIKRASTNNIPVIVAAGNNNKNIPVFPCSFNEVICVGAINNIGEIATFSNYGNRVDLLAPGRNMVSTFPINMDSELLRLKGYEIKRGTSQAAPLVTGIAAIIKNQFPSISLKNLKARLYATAKSINNDTKSSLFGLVNMNKALKYKKKNIFYPETKDIDQVIVDNKELSTDLIIPIRKLDGTAKSVKVDLVKNENVLFSKTSFALTFDADNKSLLRVNLKVTNPSLDHLIPIEFKITAPGFSKTFTINLRTSMAVKALEQINIPLENVKPLHIARFKGRKTSFLNYVFSADAPLKNPEYFYIDRDTTKRDIVDIVHLGVKDKKVKKSIISLPKTRKIIAILKGDYNLDKQQDYIVLAREIDQRKTYFYLYYYNKDFKPLWDNSIFKLDPNSSYFALGNSSLLEFDKGKPNFSFIKYKHPKLGEIMLPLISKQGLLPEVDNSKDIFDYEPIGIKLRNYVLIPNVDTGLLEQRVLFSVARRNTIEDKLKLAPLENLRFEGFFKESPLNDGVTNSLISYGYGLEREYQILRFNSFDHYELISLPHLPRNLVLAANSVFSSSAISKNENKTIFFSLYEGSKARVTYLSTSGAYQSQELDTDKFNDPFMGFIGSQFQDDHNVSWLESRYNVYAFSKNQTLQIPINRESSFPGVEFSETMETIVIDNNDRLEMGIFVNSVLLYGDQLYAIALNKNELARPLSLTVQIPDNCAYMKPSFYGGNHSSNYVFVCLNKNEKPFLKIVPLKI